MAGMYGCFKSRNSDSGSMASGPPDVMTNQEPAEVAEECSGKKKSKFQTFKKFFTRKKRKEPPAAAAAAAADAGLKASQSSDNVSKTSDNNTLTRSEKEKGSGSKISLGSKALSHDSVFVSDSSEANEALGASQDSIHGKVKSLQLQLKQAIKLGSPPSLMCVKRTEDAGTMSEDDGLPCSPPEYTTLHTAMNQVERNSSVSLEGLDSDDDQLSCAAPSRAMSPLVVPGDFSQPASPFGCLDNSAAKHKLGLRHKACNKRKPVARLELKVEGDSMNTSATEALEEKDQQKTTTEAADEPTPKVEVEEEEKKEEEKEEEEEEEESQHATQSLLRDKEQREEGEDEPEAGQDVSQGLDTSCPAEPCPSEEEVPDVRTPSSRASSGASSLDSPRNTPEPPAGHREHLLEPPAVAHEEEEDAVEGDSLPTTEEDSVQEESSFLQEVLSSLKTPLAPSPLAGEAEAGDLEVEEVKEGEDVEAEEEEEEEGAEVEEPVSNQVLPADSLPSDQTTKEEEEVSAFRSTCQDDEEEEEHKVEDKEEEAAAAEEEEEEEEELMVEQICPHSEKEEEEKGEEEEVTTEHQNDLLTENPVIQEEGRGDEESEAEEEEAEVEKQEEEVEEAEEAAEALMDVAEEMMQPKAAAEDVSVAVTLQDEGDEDDAMNTPESRDDVEIPAELHDQVMESQVASSPSCEEQEEEEEERMEEGEDQHEHKPDQEEDDGANQPDEDQTEPDVEQEAAEESHSDMERVEKDPLEATEEAPVPSKPSPLSLPESHDETEPLESAPITPSKTSTTTLHINLVSPSSEKVTSFFQHSQNVEHPKDSETLSAAEEATEQNTTSAGEEEEAGTVEAVEEEKQLVPEEEEEKETPSPASVEEPVHQSSSGSAQSKVRFTVAPAWQRSLSAEDAKDTATPPSSPPASSVSSPSSAITGPGDEESEEPASSAEGEQVFVSDRVRNTKAPAAKPQRSPTSPPSPVKTPTSASTEESSVIVEGNPDNPFGVRLRKTSGLYRFSSEEENTEPHMEPPAQSSSSKVDSPQPVSVKPSISQPASAKPALPKKPDVHGDGAGKSRRISDPAAGRGVSAGSDSPSWISVAKQKQKIYKENSLEEIAVKKEEQERKSSLPMYVSSAVSREHGGKTAESTGKVSLVESSKSSVSAEKEPRRSLSPPTPVPAQTPKSQSFPSPVPPKPQPPPATSKPPPHKSMSPPTPVPVPQKPPSCTSPPPPFKPAASANTPQPQSATVTSPPFSPRTASEKPVLKAPGLSSQTPSSQRGGPPPALPQDEPPWMALAKKKAKAWSEMPQIAPV